MSGNGNQLVAGPAQCRGIESMLPDRHAPFLVDFEVRAQVLNEVITADKWVNGREGLHIRVRRKHVFWVSCCC